MLKHITCFTMKSHRFAAANIFAARFYCIWLCISKLTRSSVEWLHRIHIVGSMLSAIFSSTNSSAMISVRWTPHSFFILEIFMFIPYEIYFYSHKISTTKALLHFKSPKKFSAETFVRVCLTCLTWGFFFNYNSLWGHAVDIVSQTSRILHKVVVWRVQHDYISSVP